MKAHTRSYYVEIYPNEEQLVLIKKQLGCNRAVWNYLLGICINRWKAGRKIPSTYDLVKTLPKLKAKPEWEFLKEVDSDALQRSALDLGAAYQNFYASVTGRRRGPKIGLPRFKKKGRAETFTQPGRARIDLDRDAKTLKLGKHVDLKCRGTLPSEDAEIRRVSVTYNPVLNRSFASILVKENVTPLAQTGLDVGVDPGLKTLLTMVTSEDQHLAFNPKQRQELKELATRIARLQMWRSKKEKGSSRNVELKRKIAVLWYRIRCIRKDFTHKVTTKMVKIFDRIHIEDTKIKPMIANGGVRKKGLNRSIAQAALGEIKRQLLYKAVWYQKQVVLVSARNTSKTCNDCGTIFKNLTLAMRKWTCVDCGSEHDRDLNAARNILHLGYSVA